METKNEMKSVPSFDELVFENRNMEYGAYQIRKKYNSALIWSILVSIFFISASVVTPFVIEMGKPIVIETKRDSTKVIFEGSTIPVDVPEQKQPKLELLKVKAPVYIAPEVVDTLSPDDATNILTNDELIATVKNDSVIDFIPNQKQVEVDPDMGNQILEIINVSEKPLFGIEGDNGFRRWIAENIQYPQIPLENGIQGRVYVQFVVEKDGSLSNIIAARAVDPELGKEAVRVVALSPKWNPGKQQGVPVRVRYTFPITFALK